MLEQPGLYYSVVVVALEGGIYLVDECYTKVEEARYIKQLLESVYTRVFVCERLLNASYIPECLLVADIETEKVTKIVLSKAKLAGIVVFYYSSGPSRSTFVFEDNIEYAVIGLRDVYSIDLREL